MPIITQSPIIIPQKTYNEIWIRRLSIEPSGPNEGDQISLFASIALASRDGNGVGEFAPEGADKQLVVASLEHEAQSDPEIASLLAQVTAKIIGMAQGKGIV